MDKILSRIKIRRRFLKIIIIKSQSGKLEEKNIRRYLMLKKDFEEKSIGNGSHISKDPASVAKALFSDVRIIGRVPSDLEFRFFETFSKSGFMKSCYGYGEAFCKMTSEGKGLPILFLAIQSFLEEHSIRDAFGFRYRDNEKNASVCGVIRKDGIESVSLCNANAV